MTTAKCKSLESDSVAISRGKQNLDYVVKFPENIFLKFFSPSKCNNYFKQAVIFAVGFLSLFLA